VQAWLKCRFMRDKLGEEFAGTVTAATSFGLFVQLDELYVEGLLHISELGGEYWRFDEVRQELRGERTGIRHGAGSKLRVQVSRVDLDARKIDFRLVGEGGADKLLSRGRRNAPLPSASSAVEELAAVRQRDREVRAAARGKDRTGVRASRTSAKTGARSKAAGAKKTRR
jgi:ribonuclease R